MNLLLKLFIPCKEIRLEQEMEKQLLKLSQSTLLDYLKAPPYLAPF
jgi:hypothetical protein